MVSLIIFAAMRDWADLLRAIAWPLVVLIAIFRFHGVLSALLSRVVRAEAMGVKVSLEKLDKDIVKAEVGVRKLKTRLPEVPQPSERTATEQDHNATGH
jgi:hypothetical protein